jgi:hypothetical protein
VWREADPWPPAAKLFVKPHELIYNKAVMPGPFTGRMVLSFAGLRSPAWVFPNAPSRSRASVERGVENHEWRVRRGRLHQRAKQDFNIAASGAEMI